MRHGICLGKINWALKGTQLLKPNPLSLIIGM
jgi:hypothetical protein